MLTIKLPDYQFEHSRHLYWIKSENMQIIRMILKDTCPKISNQKRILYLALNACCPERLLTPELYKSYEMFTLWDHIKYPY